MKNLTSTILILLSFNVHAQYFQRWFGTAGMPSKEHSLYDGVCTRENFTGSDTSFFNTGIGTAELILTDSVGLTKYDELRFVRINQKGTTVHVNKGYAFKNSGDAQNKWFNSTGRSICEIDSSNNKGGYMVVGGVKSNSLTGATATAGGDALIVALENDGTVKMSNRIDFKSGNDILYSVVASKTNANHFYACGTSVFTNSKNLIALKFTNTGSILWAFSYRLNISGIANQSKSIGYSICEGTGGNLFIAGLINDPQNGTGDDGLVVSLNSSTGSFINATAYHYSTDDHYRVIKPLSTGGYLIGGIVSVNGLQGMFMGVASASGTVNTHKIVQSVTSSGINLAATCYDAMERVNSTGPVAYYFAGTRNASISGSDALIVKTDFTCTPSAVYPYDDLGKDEAVALDYSDLTEYSAGLRLFSNITNATGFGKTDAYISRVYFNGAACTDYCPEDSIFLIAPLYNTFPVLKDSVYTNKTKAKLGKLTVNYSSGNICSQNTIVCGSNLRTSDTESMNNNYEQKITIFPNPASGQLNISFESGGIEGTIEISDYLGQVVWKEQFKNEEEIFIKSIDIKNLEQGTYLLNIKNERYSKTLRFIKY